ncbi:esterase/lipase family protein [Maridesulfovibrio sp. FT414]|uniref:esterase/lipase family protein n=1 Tax=Maridesulfovibrio sp. FT414 TaxID=2979469 RepID=UPI003D809C1B
MFKLILLAMAVLFLLPSPLVLFGILFNWRTVRNRPTDQILRELGGAIVSAGMSLFIAVCTRPFTFLNRLPLFAKGSDQRPILMVHGLYHNRTAWLFMKHRLNREGFGSLYTWQYNSFITSYPELVLALRREIRRIYEESGEEQVTLVGHSLGGLLISGASADLQVEKMVRGLITLGTPFKGSILAVMAPGRLGRSLHPESALFRGENRITYPDIAKTAIISPTDEMVLPWENLEPDPDKWDIVRCSAMGHVAMLYSRKVSATVGRLIKRM